jgi:hypothetical protein
VRHPSGPNPEAGSEIRPWYLRDNSPGLGSAAALPMKAIPAETDASCLESGLAGSAMRGIRYLVMHAQEDGLVTATVVLPLGLLQKRDAAQERCALMIDGS